MRLDGTENVDVVPFQAGIGNMEGDGMAQDTHGFKGEELLTV